jgi:hypothetical protein
MYIKIDGVYCIANKIASSGGHNGTPGRVMDIMITCKEGVIISELEERVAYIKWNSGVIWAVTRPKLFGE